MVELSQDSDSIADLNVATDPVCYENLMMPPSEPGCQTGVLDRFEAPS
jgi:hypothetical protein